MSLRLLKISTVAVALILASCQKTKDSATENVTNSVIEKTLEKAGVATENIERANKNSAEVSIRYDGESIFEDLNDFKTVMNAAGKRMLVFSINNELAKINISFSGLDTMLNEKPIKGRLEKEKMDPKDASGTVVTITIAKEDGFAYSYMEGEAVITNFQQDLVELEFKGKAAPFLEANNPENWKVLEGKITCKFPAMSLIQVKKEELFY